MKKINIEQGLIDRVAKIEDVGPEHICQGVKDGTIVVLKNKKHNIDRPCAVGKGLTTKINANIGVSPGYSGIELEMDKMEEAVKAGATILLAASEFHFNIIEIPKLKVYLRQEGINV